MCYQQVMDGSRVGSSLAHYTVYYEPWSDIIDFQNSVQLEAENSVNRISISIPDNFTEQQLQVQVGLTIFSNEGLSTPLTVGKTIATIINNTYCIAI